MATNLTDRAPYWMWERDVLMATVLVEDVEIPCYIPFETLISDYRANYSRGPTQQAATEAFNASHTEIARRAADLVRRIHAHSPGHAPEALCLSTEGDRPCERIR